MCIDIQKSKLFLINIIFTNGDNSNGFWDYLHYVQAHNFYVQTQDSQVSLYYTEVGMKNCAEALKFFWISSALNSTIQERKK